MDRNEFRGSARELLERHVSEPEPTRPEGHPGERYAVGQLDYVSETTAALKNDARINRDYYEHASRAQERGQVARAELEQHINKEKAPADRAALDEHMSRTEGSSPARADAREALDQHIDKAERGQVPEQSQDVGRKPDIDRDL